MMNEMKRARKTPDPEGLKENEITKDFRLEHSISAPSDEELDRISQELMEKNQEAYEELGK